MNKVDKHWYKTAIFMELNVRAYRDSNADGWGRLAWADVQAKLH